MNVLDDDPSVDEYAGARIGWEISSEYSTSRGAGALLEVAVVAVQPYVACGRTSTYCASRGIPRARVWTISMLF